MDVVSNECVLGRFDVKLGRYGVQSLRLGFA